MVYFVHTMRIFAHSMLTFQLVCDILLPKGVDNMAKVSTNISIDAETKAKAQVLLADFGMDLSTAVNIFLRQMIYEGNDMLLI